MMVTRTNKVPTTVARAKAKTHMAATGSTRRPKASSGGGLGRERRNTRDATPGSQVVCRGVSNLEGETQVHYSKRSPKDRIVITGMGVASCYGQDTSVFYDSLLAGKSGVRKLDDMFDTSNLAVTFAAPCSDDVFSTEGYIDRKNARRQDKVIKLCITTGKKSLEDAGLVGEELEKLDKARCGCLVGSGIGGMTFFEKNVHTYYNRGPTKVSPFFIPYIIPNMPSAMLAMDVGFMGPNYSVSTACATANYCYHLAARHIRNGDADLMLVGGTEAPVNPIALAGFHACRALSTSNEDPAAASRPWDKNRNGFVMGEGCGTLVMESLEHAQARGANILAEYLGGAVTCDAHHMTEPREDGFGVRSCMELAMADAGIEREEVNYINAHATSTPLGDVAEVAAIKKVFSDTSHLKMNATKSMTGHALGAAGGLEAVACVKAIETGLLHPTINLLDCEESIDIDTCAGEKKEHQVTAAMSNSFGFGGHNSVCIFGPYKE